MKRSMETEWTQESWRGSPAELVKLLSEAAKIVTKASGENGSEISVTLGQRGDDLSFDNLPEFSEFIQSGHPRLREARRLRAVCGRYSSIRLTFFFRHSLLPTMYALSATVNGSDPVSVDGVAAEARRLARRNGRRWRTNFVAWPIWAVGMLLIVPSLFSDSSLSSWLANAGLPFSFAAAFLLFGYPLLVPRFEIIDPHAPESRNEKVRRSLTGSGRWLLAAVGGAIIYALAEKLING